MPDLEHHLLTEWREIQRQSWRFIRRRDRGFQGIYAFLPRPAGGWKLAVWIRLKHQRGDAAVLAYRDRRYTYIESLSHAAWLWRVNVDVFARRIGIVYRPFPRGRVSGHQGVWRVSRSNNSPVPNEFRRVCRVFRLDPTTTTDRPTHYHRVDATDHQNLMIALHTSPRVKTHRAVNLDVNPSHIF